MNKASERSKTAKQLRSLATWEIVDTCSICKRSKKIASLGPTVFEKPKNIRPDHSISEFQARLSTQIKNLKKSRGHFNIFFRESGQVQDGANNIFRNFGHGNEIVRLEFFHTARILKIS